MTRPSRRDFVQAVPVLGPDLADAVTDSSVHAPAGAGCPAAEPALPRDDSAAAGGRAVQAEQVR
jgi:hypothetical protein